LRQGLIGLELSIILPQSPKCWDYRYKPGCLAFDGIFSRWDTAQERNSEPEGLSIENSKTEKLGNKDKKQTEQKIHSESTTNV
jgi:hypothetical protein